MKFIKDIELFFLRNMKNCDLELVLGNLIMSFLVSELLIQVNCYSNEISLPKKAFAKSAGYDLFAHQTIKVHAGSRTVVSTELRMSIPKDFFGRISPRSGLAANYGIVAFDGTIDSGYRGIIYVLLFNFSKDDYIVEKGNRIAQIIFQKYENVSFLEDSFDFTSERDVKGFQSPGL